MSDRAEFEKRNPVPEGAIWSEKKQGYYWSNYPTVAHPLNDDWEVWQEAVEYVRAQSGQGAEASDIEKLRCQQCGNMEPFHATGCKTEFGSYSGATPQPAQQGRVPEWMTEVSENLATQDNRITQDPLFVVFQKREIVAHEDYDHDRISWGNCEGEADDEVQDWLNDAREDVDGDHYLDDEIEFHDEDSGTETFRRVALKETDEFVTACFTEAGAKDYLKANGHNLTRPHIYVTSLYRNEEMKRMREWLLSATAPQPQEGSGDE